MNLMKSLCRRIGCVSVAVVWFLAVHGAAIAAPQQNQPQPTEGSYVMPYAIVILTIGVGIALASRPSRRRDRAKPEQYDSAKKTGADE